MRDRVDLLHTCERTPEDHPSLRDDEDPHRGYWHGSATGEVLAWKRRALAAENLVDRLLATIRGWRPHS